MSLRFRYQPPNLAISTLYWKAWPLLLVVAAFNPENIGEPPPASSRSSCRVLLLRPVGASCLLGLRVEPGPGLGGGRDPRWGGSAVSWPPPAVSLLLGLAAWEEYPTLKMLMEMVMTK